MAENKIYRVEPDKFSGPFDDLFRPFASYFLTPDASIRRMKKNTQESLRLHREIRAKPKMCYTNAVKVIRHVPGYKHAFYVEGVVVLGKVVVIEHGWVERHGEICDPTLPLDKVAYFPGLRLEGKRSIQEAMRRPEPITGELLPLFHRFADCCEMQRAWERAIAFADASPVLAGF